MLVAGRSRCFVMFCALVMMLLASPQLFSGPPVALTDPLTPQEQQKKFKLPKGFEIQLVAAEPDIQKPMNLAFDARGRLWVTHSVEYPFAAADAEKSQDGLTILEGIGPDGRATKVTKFADKLNIPIGVLPLPSGNEAIVWSIPNIWKLTDTDGDGKADKREILYGPFDFVDTHGDQNAFRLGNDGWVYACHGFRNASKIKLRGAGPVVLEMQSGNAYRFKTDGSAIEQISWGQVNPFGMCIDARGDLFTADCHSKPITMLLRGGHYDSFGKPDDGLGFAPITTSNDHGSTGIAGVVSYASDHFPREYAGSMFVGNVVTNIVHRDTVQWRGSSPWVEKPEDFLTTDDWWFHPVDLQLGPEGALYISDFYNSIIGHYEVDLKHPRRDRHRGRIWRIVYTGQDQKVSAPAVPNLTALSTDELLSRLSDSNTTVRNLVAYELQKRLDADGVAKLKVQIQPPASGSSTDVEVGARQAGGRAQGLWLLWRLGQLDESLIQKLAHDPAGIVRVHLVRALGETATWSPAIANLVRSKLKDLDPFVQRATAEALARHPDSMNLQPLVQAWNSAPAADVQLIHAVRIAIR
ncbi:MAG: rane-bound dehydrogenase domain protein, partial [Planctomycetaceae bacterium]|nr:rane-bound dehydrogenase domain protein [Planctomycetaceae bacterium]